MLSDGKTPVLPILFRIVFEPQISISFAQQKLPEESDVLREIRRLQLSFCGFLYFGP